MNKDIIHKNIFNQSQLNSAKGQNLKLCLALNNYNSLFIRCTRSALTNQRGNGLCGFLFGRLI